MKHKPLIEKTIALISLLLIITAFIGGSLRLNQSQVETISQISPLISHVEKITESLYLALKTNADPNLPENKFFISIAQYPSYGGQLKVAVVVNGIKEIELVSILNNSDTSTYIQKVVDEGVLNAFLGKKIDMLPQVHTISSATLSSKAIIESVKEASQAIGVYEFNMPRVQERADKFTISQEEYIKLGILALFFIAALFISSKYYFWKKNLSMLILSGISILVLGFMYSMQFSLSTIALFLSGSWLNGIATLAPLICLILAVGTFIFTKKNLYCTCICPYGGIQECISRITSCHNPKTNVFMLWASRILALSFLCFALYFRNFSLANYEPFSRTFNFIGSTFLFVLSFIVIISSLFVKRPWCKLLCPITPFFDYLQFMRTWLLPTKKVNKASQVINNTVENEL